jgi:hypothetical protein
MRRTLVLTRTPILSSLRRIVPQVAAEKLAEHHGYSVSRETLRDWMIAPDG